MHLHRFLCTLLVLLCLGGARAHAQSDDDGFEVIRLQHRDAASLVPMLRGLYGNKLIISGMGMKIFVKGPAAMAAEAKQVATSLDGKPRMLRVAIRSPGQSSSKSTSYAINGKAKVGPITVSNRAPAAGGGLIISNAPQTGAGLQAQQISVTQNSSAERYVMVEEGVPATITDASGNQMVVRVTGDTTSVQLASSPSGTNAAGLGTTVSAPNGQWMTIGGNTNSAQTNGSGLLNQSSSNTQSSGQTMLQVTPVN